MKTFCKSCGEVIHPDDIVEINIQFHGNDCNEFESTICTKCEQAETLRFITAVGGKTIDTQEETQSPLVVV